jgi:hypothetical protein
MKKIKVTKWGTPKKAKKKKILLKKIYKRQKRRQRGFSFFNLNIKLGNICLSKQGTQYYIPRANLLFV